MSIAALHLKDGWRKFFWQKGNGNRRGLGTLERKKEQQDGKRKGKIIDNLSHEFLKSYLIVETKVITASLVVFNICWGNSWECELKMWGG